ncbi:LapA family protein [Pelomicrobium methylotrophicum]|uniref:LapA family protein n=1 Tax=Pelomicrobium methylotrophicum TaxID=2602750 RepID=A0A5C7EVR7_9PROT|nr:LapA family protein [Pelomicrobium methylotrophicum]TXF12447.1 LapA family protein [Pelomicrobium methylotrophicum]
MRVVSWILRIILFLLLLTFALKNMDEVTVRYYFGIEWQAPLALVIFVFFVAGTVIGVIAGFVGELGRRRRRAQAVEARSPLDPHA